MLVTKIMLITVVMLIAVVWGLRGVVTSLGSLIIFSVIIILVNTLLYAIIIGKEDRQFIIDFIKSKLPKIKK